MESNHDGKVTPPDLNRGASRQYGKYDYEDFVVNDGGSFTESDIIGAPWSKRLMSSTLEYQ